MVTKKNTDCNFDTTSAVNGVKLLSTWIGTLVASTFLLGRFCPIKMLAIVFLLIGSIETYAQTALPTVTVVANEFRPMGDSGNNYIFFRDEKPDSTLVVNYKTIATGGIETAGTVTIAAGKYTVQEVIPDTQSHTRVEIVSATSYTIGTPSFAEKLASSDITTSTAGKPGMTIYILEDTVTEGGSFTVIAPITPPTTSSFILLFLTASDPGNLIDSFVPDFAIGGGSTERITTMTIVDDNQPGTEGTVTLSLQGQITVHNPTINNSDTITVVDNDGDPVVRINPLSPKVEEGGSVNFSISSSRIPSDTGLAISFSTNENGTTYLNNITNSSNVAQTSPITLAASDNPIELTLNTHDRTSTNGDGLISVSISNSANYDIAENNGVMNVRVIDKNSTRPTITVAPDPGQAVDEGGSLSFTLTSNFNAPAGGIVVSYRLTEIGEFIDDTKTGDAKAIIPSGGRTVSIPIDLKTADSMHDSDGIITLEIVEDSTPMAYQLNKTNNSHIATVIIKDTSRPTGVHIKSITATQITEGMTAIIQIGAEEVVNVDRIINITSNLAGLQNRLSETIPSTVTIPANLPSVLLNIPTTDDNSFESYLEFDLSIAEATPPTSATYMISTNQSDNSLTIRIIENDDPPTGISIKSVYTSVTEDQSPKFQISNDTIIQTASIVLYTLSISESSGDDFLDSSQSTTLSDQVFPQNKQFIQISISLEDDKIDEEDGEITVTITSVTGPATKAAGSDDVATVVVLDNDEPPVIKLAVSSSNVTDNSIVETNVAQDIEFTYSIKTDSSAGITTEESTSDITIHYSVVENVGDFLADGAVGDDKTEVLDAGDDDGDTFVVSVEGDTEDEINGNFTVTLKPDVDTNIPKTYTVSQVDSERTITINVTDDDVPIVTMTTDQSTVFESDDIIVNLATNIAPHQDLEIELCVSDGSNTSTGCSNPLSSTPSGDFLKIPLSTIMVTLPVGANSVSPGQNYTIKLDDDVAKENDGNVIAYFAFMEFTADETGYALDFTSDTTKSQISVMVEDNDPTISIAANDSDNSIVEGEDAVFTITSNAQITTQQLLVQVKISQEGEYWDISSNMTKGSTSLDITLDQTTGIRSIMVPIPVGSNSASFTIETDDDDGVMEDSGSISAEIIVPDQNPEYSKGSNFKAVLNVVDNDDPTPEISIQSVQTEAVEEGETIIFELTANKAIPDNGLEILVCIRDGSKKSDNTGCTIDTMGVGDYLAEPVPKQITMPANAPERKVRIEVPTIDDNSIDVAGTIYAEVLTNSNDDGYRPLAVRKSATVQITDNDPSLSISYQGWKGGNC